MEHLVCMTGSRSGGASSSGSTAAGLVDSQSARGEPEGAAIHSDQEAQQFTLWIFAGRVIDSGLSTSIHSHCVS
jgi:hypothetical protein